MKKILIISTLLVLLSLTAIPALAHGQVQPIPLQAPPQVYGLNGRITAVDTAARTVTVKVWSGNWLAREYKGKEVTLKATDYTRFQQKLEDCTVVPADFEDLKVGQRITASGRVVNEVWRIWRITIRPAECCCQENVV
jgi:hypothetical protein